MTATNRRESVTQRSSAPLRLVSSQPATITERAAILSPLPGELSESEVARKIGTIVTDFKQSEQRQKAKAMEELKTKKTSDRADYTRDAMDAQDANNRARMATAVLRGFGMLDAAVETDFASVYKQADQRAVQSTGASEEDKRIRSSMMEAMGNYIDHPAIRAARTVVEVSVTGGATRRDSQTMIMQRAIAEVFDQEGIPPTPDAG